MLWGILYNCEARLFKACKPKVSLYTLDLWALNKRASQLYKIPHRDPLDFYMYKLLTLA